MREIAEPERDIISTGATYCAAISNHRIESIDGNGSHGPVTFWCKDLLHHKVRPRTRLPGVEFLPRFFAHVLPRGFMRIRSFGLLANWHRASLSALRNEPHWSRSAVGVGQ